MASGIRMCGLVCLLACATEGGEPPASDAVGPTVNQLPVVQTRAFEVVEDTVFEDQIVAVDPEGGPLEFRLGTPTEHGRLSLGSEGAFQYVPGPNYFGPDVFEIIVGDGVQFTPLLRIELDVRLLRDDPPIVGDVRVGTPPDVPVSGRIPAVDPDDDPLQWDVSVPPFAGEFELVGNAGDFVYTPGPLFARDRVEVTVFDGVFRVTGRVDLFDSRPTVGSASFTTPEDTVLVAQVPVLPAGSTTRIDQPPRNGVVSLDPSTGGFAYEPNRDFSGLDDFTVLSTGALPGRMTIQVTPVNDPP
ncbi:MAG: Ig-like domain-containing protein, partial [Myxococcota bacterium]